MIRALFAGKLVYPLQERLLKRPTFGYLAGLERSQWLPRADVEKLQEEKLAALISAAREHCSWHRARIEAAGVAPADRVPLKVLRKLPLMDKKDAAAHREQMVWRGVPGGIYKYNTGGSSGEPLIFYYGRRRQASDAAELAGQLRHG